MDAELIEFRGDNQTLVNTVDAYYAILDFIDSKLELELRPPLLLSPDQAPGFDQVTRTLVKLMAEEVNRRPAESGHVKLRRLDRKSVAIVNEMDEVVRNLLREAQWQAYLTQKSAFRRSLLDRLISREPGVRRPPFRPAERGITDPTGDM